MLAIAEQSLYRSTRARIVFAVVYIQEAADRGGDLIRMNRFRVGPLSALSAVGAHDGEPSVLRPVNLFPMIFPLTRDAPATMIYCDDDGRFAPVLIEAFERLPQLPQITVRAFERL